MPGSVTRFGQAPAGSNNPTFEDRCALGRGETASRDPGAFCERFRLEAHAYGHQPTAAILELDPGNRKQVRIAATAILSGLRRAKG